jgi:hypothetical protein
MRYQVQLEICSFLWGKTPLLDLDKANHWRPHCASTLGSFGSTSVLLYGAYAAVNPLPQLLTPKIVLEVMKQLYGTILHLGLASF